MAIAIAAVVATGCPRTATDGKPPPDRGFTVGIDGDGCPTDPKRFGPADSECDDKATDCVVVTHGRPVAFNRAPEAPSDKEFFVLFTDASPLDDGKEPKFGSKNGKIHRNTLSTLPAKKAFPFKLQAPHGSVKCKEVDPQIILN